MSTQSRLLSEFPPPAPDAWRRAAEESLEGAPFEKKLVTRLPEGIQVQPIYTRAVAALGEEAGLPGQTPFVRGPRSVAASSAGWLISQELPYGQPDAFNQALRQDLNRGQNAVNLLLDIATRSGLDPDAANAGEVGACGLSIATVADLERALDGVDLTAVPVHVQAGATAGPLLAMLVRLMARRGLPAKALHGAVLADPIGEWVQSGSLNVGLDAALDALASTVRWAREATPQVRVIGVQANLWAEAGGHAAQELGFGLATAADYLRKLEARGCAPHLAVPSVAFTFSLGAHFFVELAKLRAARLLWARFCEVLGVTGPSAGLVCHGRSALWNKTQLDPHVNLLRATTEAFAGIAGGCESMHIAAFDESFRVPDDFSRRLARNTQIILGEECQLSRVIDPAGGSWYVESLTRELAQKAWAIFQDVESRGGMEAAVSAGLPQAEVAKAGAARQAGAESRRDGIVGTNVYPNLKESPPPTVLPDYAALARDRAARAAGQRVGTEVEQSARVMTELGRLLEGAPSDRMDTMVTAFGQGATLGEVTRTLRAGAPAAPAVTPLRFARRADPFERLRRRAEAHRQSKGHLPKVFLANMGPRKQHAARAEFSAGFFAAGGLEVIPTRGFASVAEAADAAIASAAPVVTICSTDDTYPEIVPALARALAAAPRRPLIVLAGYPTDHIAAFREAGVDEFIHLRANCAETLSALLQKLGL